MKKLLHCTVIAAGLLCPLASESASTLSEAILNGKPSAQLRYRYENVGQEGAARHAQASTLRTLLDYSTDGFEGFSAFLQFEDVSVLGNDIYNSSANGNTGYPTVADPEDSEVNQIFLSYETPYSTVLRFGRQAMNLDNQRFIGSVNWRQNMQTLDAATLVNSSLPDTTITYAHVLNVNKINGEHNSNRNLANRNMSSDLIHVNYKGLGFAQISAYGYLLDYKALRSESQKTLGARFDGKYPLPGDNKLFYTAEYAKQSPYENAAASNKAEYLLIGLGAELRDWVQIRLMQEKLGGNGSFGFATPLATLHAFNGWADMFLNTPKDGLRDRYLQVSSTLMETDWMARYHQFASVNLGYAYGHEIDLQAVKKVNKYLSMTAKLAAYSGDKNSSNSTRNPALSKDMTKYWLQADVLF